MADSPTTILFLCTGNSARSILAEAIANQMFGDTVRAVSAGSRPRGTPHPLALRTLEARGLAAAGLRSKHVNEFRDRTFDLVVTLCDSAAGDPCPILPGAPLRVHWGLPDPPAAVDPARTFHEVFDALMQAMQTFTTLTHYDLKARAEIVRRRIAAHLPASQAAALDIDLTTPTSTA